MNTYYEELYHFVCGKHLIDPECKIEHQGYYLTVNDYLVAVSIRDKTRRILVSMRRMHGKQMLLGYLRGAITGIIIETLGQNPDYADFYQDKIKKAS